MADQFDVVITSVEKDQFMLQRCLLSIKQYVKGFRRIIVVSNNQLTTMKGVEWFDEKRYPFTTKDVYENLCNYGEQRDRKFSYINQILKLYAHRVIPDLTDNILICDSDIVFVRELTFMEEGMPIYNHRLVPFDEYVTYFNHFLLLSPTFTFMENPNNIEAKKSSQIVSGITHHIMYNKDVINELLDLVEKTNDNKTFWKYYLNVAVHNEYEPANCELYFNYVYKFHRDKIKLRALKWFERAAEGTTANEFLINFNKNFPIHREYALANDYYYIGYHSYDRESFQQLSKKEQEKEDHGI
tara:strand:- start:3136 stop:4032 length:897 start_codon:yes stop_codon:yes gene_type:complete